MFIVGFTHILVGPKCRYSELINGKHRVKSLEDAAFEKFKGSCVVRIIHAFSGKTKGITICADEILNYDSKKSYFDEFPEESRSPWGPTLWRDLQPPSRAKPAE